MTFKWKFWQATPNSSGTNGVKTDKLQKPQELPDRIGRHMVVKMGLEPDFVWSLRCVYRKKADEPGVGQIRIFESQCLTDMGVRHLNYDLLNNHPELILYQGTYRKDSDNVVLARGRADKRMTAA
ncbi:MAG: hypothetical protein RBQ72_10265 [Desulfobacterium sp.]|jgi:hypothetical protein|nr:hypothetical protein [Desulfobacterium sp.]